MGSLIAVIAVIAGIVILVQSIIIFFFVDEVCHTSNTKPLSRGDD